MANTEPEPRWFWQDGKQFKPYNSEDSELIEVIFRTGGSECEVQDGTAVVDIPKRQHKEKHTNKTSSAVRATFFWQDTNKEWMPYTEVTAAMLERAFEAGIFGVNIPLSDDGNRYAVLNPNGTGTHHPGGNAPTRAIRRGWEGRTIPKVVEQKPAPRKLAVSDLIDLSGSGSIPAPAQVAQTQPQHQPYPAVQHSQLSTSSPAFVPTYLPQQPQASAPAQPVQTTIVQMESPGVRRTSSVSRSDVKPSRGDGVLKEGYVSKKSGRVFIWKERWLVLTKDWIAVYVDRTKEKAKIPLARLTRCELVKGNQGAGDSNPNSSKNDNCHFNVFAINGHVYYFRASSPSEAQAWVDAITEARFGEKKEEPTPVPHDPVTTTTVVTVNSAPVDPAIISVGAMPPHGYMATYQVPGYHPHPGMPGPMPMQMPVGQPYAIPAQGQPMMTMQHPMQGHPMQMSMPMPGQPMPMPMPGQPMPMQYMTGQPAPMPVMQGQPMPMPGQPYPHPQGYPQYPPSLHQQPMPPLAYQPQYGQPMPQQPQPQPPTQQFANMRM